MAYGRCGAHVWCGGSISIDFPDKVMDLKIGTAESRNPASLGEPARCVKYRVLGVVEGLTGLGLSKLMAEGVWSLSSKSARLACTTQYRVFRSISITHTIHCWPLDTCMTVIPSEVGSKPVDLKAECCYIVPVDYLSAYLGGA